MRPALLVLLWSACTLRALAGDPACLLREGDVIARHGTGFWSNSCTQLSEKDRRFSHVGIIVLERGAPWVVHMDVNDFGVGRVCQVPLREYVEFSTAWSLFRFRTDAATSAKVGAYARAVFARVAPFDMEFDLADHRAMYCTELVWCAAQDGLGQDIAPVKRVVNGKTYLSPENIYRSAWLEELPLSPAARTALAAPAPPRQPALPPVALSSHVRE